MHLTLIPHQQTYIKCLVCYKDYKTFVAKAKIFTGGSLLESKSYVKMF